MQQLLCEPEDRLGSQTSASIARPNSMVVQARRSMLVSSSNNFHREDGANIIKVWHYFNHRPH